MNYDDDDGGCDDDDNDGDGDGDDDDDHHPRPAPLNCHVFCRCCCTANSNASPPPSLVNAGCCKLARSPACLLASSETPHALWSTSKQQLETTSEQPQPGRSEAAI